MTDDTRCQRRHIILAAVLFALAAATRLVHAYLYRNFTTADCGIVALMAKHVAEGGAVPVFFYGQAYMGSPEPLVSALFCRLFGVSGVNVCLGTAALSIAAVPIVYLWARAAGGRTAGVAALACVVVGPYVYAVFQVAPRGGYAAVLLLGSLVSWQSCRLLVRERRGERVRGRDYFGLALLAGVGWWANQIVVFYLLPAVLLFALVLRRRLFTWPPLAAVPGFVLGSLPYWLWNLRHEGRSLTFLLHGESGSDARFDVSRAVQRLFGKRLEQLHAVGGMPEVAADVAIVLHGFLMVAAAVLVGRRVLRRDRDDTVLYQAMALLTLVVSLAIYVSSRFAFENTARYLVPMVPVVAVLVGCATAWLVARLPCRLGWLPVVVIVVLQLPTTPHVSQRHAERDDRYRRARQLAGELRQRHLDVVYAPYAYHWLNFGLDEEFVFCDLRPERVRAYARRAERSDRIAVLRNYGMFSAFLSNTRGSAQVFEIARKTVHHDVAPPRLPLAEISPADWAAAVGGNGRSLLTMICDGDVGTAWRGPATVEGGAGVDITFVKPVTVAAVRWLAGSDGVYPKHWQIYGRAETNGPWRALTAELTRTHFFWSGPRPYHDGRHYRLECRFPRQTVTALRVVGRGSPGRPPWTLAELQVFGAGAERPSEVASVAELLALIEQRAIDRVYCDRWLANCVDVQFAGQVWAPLEDGIYRGLPATTDRTLRLSPGCALVIDANEAVRCRERFERRGIAMRETAVGPWVMFDFAPDQWREAFRADAALQWVGFTALAGR